MLRYIFTQPISKANLGMQDFNLRIYKLLMSPKRGKVFSLYHKSLIFKYIEEVLNNDIEYFVNYFSIEQEGIDEKFVINWLYNNCDSSSVREIVLSKYYSLIVSDTKHLDIMYHNLIVPHEIVLTTEESLEYFNQLLTKSDSFLPATPSESLRHNLDKLSLTEIAGCLYDEGYVVKWFSWKTYDNVIKILNLNNQNKYIDLFLILFSRLLQDEKVEDYHKVEFCVFGLNYINNVYPFYFYIDRDLQLKLQDILKPVKVNYPKQQMLINDCEKLYNTFVKLGIFTSEVDDISSPSKQDKTFLQKIKNYFK